MRVLGVRCLVLGGDELLCWVLGGNFWVLGVEC